MKTAVVYVSRSGHTAAIAEAVATGAGTKAVSADTPEAVITEYTDVLIVGGALYAYGLDKRLKEYLQSLPADKIGRAAVFSTSWLSRHALDLMKNILEDKGIEVLPVTFWCRSKDVSSSRSTAEQFGKHIIQD